jgi:hypothetical protein
MGDVHASTIVAVEVMEVDMVDMVAVATAVVMIPIATVEVEVMIVLDMMIVVIEAIVRTGAMIATTVKTEAVMAVVLVAAERIATIVAMIAEIVTKTATVASTVMVVPVKIGSGMLLAVGRSGAAPAMTEIAMTAPIAIANALVSLLPLAMVKLDLGRMPVNLTLVHLDLSAIRILEPSHRS